MSKILINYKGVVSSITIITMDKGCLRKIGHTIDNPVEQGKFKLESAVRKRWHIHNVKEILITWVPLFGGHPKCKFLEILKKFFLSFVV